MKRWETVRTSILHDIEAGALKAGDRLPGDHALAGRFGVNRHTVRNAIRVLADEGALRVQHGVGTFVAEDFIVHELRRDPQFTKSPAGKNRDIRREILSIANVPAPDDVATFLEIAPKELVTQVRSINHVDGSPLAVGVAYYPVKRVPGLAEAFEGNNSPTAALKKCGISKYERVWTRVGAARASADEAKHLQISSSSPVLVERNLDSTPDGAPIKFGANAIRADRFEFVVRAGEQFESSS